jgi:hypothetical protein
LLLLLQHPSFIHSSIHSSIHSFIHSSIHSSIHSFIHSSIHSFIHSFIHSSIHSFFIVVVVVVIMIVTILRRPAPNLPITSYGYREWTEKEKQAHYGAWHDIGVRMGIRSIPASIDDAAKYLDWFEAREMVYSDSNREISEYTMALFLGDLPRLLRPLARRLLYAMMDDLLLAAMGYPKQPRWLSNFLKLGLRASQRVFTRWFLPPRPLEKATFRIWKPGCPALPGKMPVGPPRFRAAPCVYADTGYRIDELGPLHPGKLAPPVVVDDGDDNHEHQPLFCPLEASSQLPWPQSLFPQLSS